MFLVKKRNIHIDEINAIESAFLRYPLTSDEVLLSWTVDAGQVSVVLPAVSLSILPVVSSTEVPVAVPMKLPPGVLTACSIWRC